MLAVLKVSVWIHRPPNLPQWKVEYSVDGLMRERFVYAPDEIAAWADTVRWVRWKEETFGLSVDQKT